MLESIETRGIVLYIRSFVRMTSWSKSSRRSQEADVFCQTCGKITVESHVATFGNSRYVVDEAAHEENEGFTFPR